LGNNQALLVLDNVITPSNVLGNLNPEDIEDIQVLNGAGAAALYGSDASNGALIVTTKRGKNGKTEVKVSNTTTFETVSFLPQLQKEFGSGTTPDSPPTYTAYENQQYGPRFDGTMKDIGQPLENGTIQRAKYSPTNARTDFWETGMMNQTDFSVSSGDDKSKIFASGQYFTQESTVPMDKYKRYSFRANVDRKIGESLTAAVSASYIANNYDVSSAVGTAYNDVLMSPAQVDITKYSNWKGNPTSNFANPNGYYNAYYDNPYFTLENNRAETKYTYFQGTMELKWNPIKPLTITGRLGMSSRNIFSKNYTGKFDMTEYTKAIQSSKTDVAGSVSDAAGYANQLITDFLAEYKTKLSEDVSLSVVGGFQARDNTAKNLSYGASGLVVSDLYNVGNTTTNITGGESNFRATQLGVYGLVTVGFKDFLYVNITGRNDWRSVLSKENRSFFYPKADVSFIVSDAVSALRDSEWLDALKLRASVSKVGQVNIAPYALNATFNQAYGYPYPSGGGFSLSNTLVSPDLEPEITTAMEAGFDLDLKKYSASIGATFYKSNTVDQTVPSQISSASGYNVFQTNVGEVENTGIEAYIQATPIETSYGLSVFVRATYSLNRNKVVALADGADVMVLGTSGTTSRIIAKVGEPFPFLQVTKYDRTEDGRVIVNPTTGFASSDLSFKDVGTTLPPHILGLTTEVKYKNFRLAATAEYRNGHYIYNAVSTSYDFSGAGIRTTWFNRDRFVFPNSAYRDPENPGTDDAPNYIDNTSITTATGGADFWTDGTRNTGIGENYTHSAGFWKIREISLRYDFPASWLSATKVIKGASLSVQGRNLFIWTPKTNLYTDPEYSALGVDSNAIGFTSINLTPPARYVGGTISLTF
jgi:TonB-linked SusC/RagA family outer membrane protein